MRERLHALSDALDRDRNAMVELLRELVSVPTENPPGHSYERCAALIEAAVNGLGFDCERIVFESGGEPRIVLIASDSPPGPTLYFHGHYDVVPASVAGQFEPRIEGDTMFGRGTSDMKSGLVAMIYAAKVARELGCVPATARISLVFVPDEETGGRFGTAALVESGHLDVDALGMLLPEPTSGVVWNANRGAISLRVMVKGRAAHVGLAHTGVNAFERALPIVNELLALKEQLSNRSVLLVGGRVEAGSNFNVVPGECCFTVDRRLNPDENLYEERGRLLDLFERARAGGADFDVEVIQEGCAAATPADDPLAEALRSSIADVTGAAPDFELCPGLLETRFYAERGIPALAYGPGILAVSHGPQEFVKLGRVVDCAKIYALTAGRFLESRTVARGRQGPDSFQSE